MNRTPQSKKEEQNDAQIVFLGETGFPRGLGAIQRMTLVSQALIASGVSVTVLCRKGNFKANQSLDFDKEGVFKGIAYKYTSGNLYRPERFLKRNWQKLKGMMGEYKYLKKARRENQLLGAIISNHSALHVLRYAIYGKILGIPMILNYVELASVMKGREAWRTQLNDRIFDRWIIRLMDAALPISEKLMSHYGDIAPGIPLLKVPILCDFEKFAFKPGVAAEKIKFLYCGAASYRELVEFILKAFESLDYPAGKAELQLILGGKPEEIQKVEALLNSSPSRPDISLRTNLPHSAIPEAYSNASALLIPLRPTLQDAARFPHKIGEYLGSGRPVITTAFGEINHFPFEDEKSALVAETYTVADFGAKMQWVLANPEEAQKIGYKGREMGIENFSYTTHGAPIKSFLMELSKK